MLKNKLGQQLTVAEAEIVAVPVESNEVESGPRYPHIRVKLVGEDGNAFAILGRVYAALRKAGVSAEERGRFQSEATSGDYDHLLQTCMAWVEVL